MSNEHLDLGTKLQAPAGGAVSSVNGLFYDGGQFMPDTGLSKSSRGRVKKFAVTTEGNIATIAVDGEWLRVAVVGCTRSKLVGPFASAEESRSAAELLVAMRSEASRAKGFVPHPTEIYTTAR